ncbi:hypothetical protein QT970_01445 [Microcoleus sp. herbarium8]|uniref:hypothetical protein n=1 Tax=Microcoleus sp. herbarium8 TaxID=3055436 RepID=UPI002FD56778
MSYRISHQQEGRRKKIDVKKEEGRRKNTEPVSFSFFALYPTGTASQNAPSRFVKKI